MGDRYLIIWVHGALSIIRMKNAYSSACMSIHAIIFTVITCLIALHREATKITEVQEFDLVAVAATICSLARLVYDTCQNYRQNGFWIYFNMIMVILYSCFALFCDKGFPMIHVDSGFGVTLILMHATGVCTPTTVVQQIMILHCAMLLRLLFDLNKNCGIMLKWTVLKCKTKIFYGVSNELIAARHTKACRPDAATFLVWQEWSPTQRGKKLSRWMPSVHSRDDVSTKQFWQHTNVLCE